MIILESAESILSIKRKTSIDEYVEKVKEIVEEVRKKGDKAIIEFTERFDGVKLNPEKFKINEDEIERAYEVVEYDLIDALELARENIEKFHTITAPQETFVDFDYAFMGKKYVPIESVGVYVPGGRASYPSTALMACIPAKIAGVNRIVVCTPPSKNGSVNPITLVACDMGGANEIYRIGGAQSIAALAYGTETIKPVLKIVGPGNIYVTAAKILVSKDVAIDMPAGPSEILIIADDTADPDLIALDCLAQLEHDPMAVAVVLTTSDYIIKSLTEKIKKDVKNLYLAKVSSIEKAIELSNLFAPEHLELVFDGAENSINLIKNAGSVFIGEYSGVAFGDYISGTNHILPTAGYAKMFSGLSVETFMKSITFQQIREKGVFMMCEKAAKIAKAEGLEYHALSLEERIKKLKG